jgi:hypothetical protein
LKISASAVRFREVAFGGVAQLGERGFCNSEVAGSIPATSTNLGGNMRIDIIDCMEKKSIIKKIVEEIAEECYVCGIPIATDNEFFCAWCDCGGEG